MGRYKDYQRDSRRGVFEDDQPAPISVSGSRFGRERVSVSQTPAVEAVVKWFQAEKGYGFVSVEGGAEAFMHVRQLEAAGHRSVSEGDKVKVRIAQGQKGSEVTEVVEVLGSSAVGTAVEPPRIGSSTGNESIGTVKLYKADKGFGFIEQDGGGKDVFVRAKALARAGLSGVVAGQRVRMQIGHGPKGLEALSLVLLD
ncbi:cold-shock protein [Rhodoplanes sp. Z2-YC6860]|uniref:cold-shock protein n=1 Tax=Rhodoplanes sp. Z2-YC6860 TaxID=674703 RepID=UPI0018DC5074|nr:cold-shock protein [Rhodoplanes sp. Z2-YC6860]